jgi:hypothetical protein
MVAARGGRLGEVVEVVTLDGVGHGTTLAGRYRLEERLQAAERTSMWRARDTTLDRLVSVRLVAGGPGETAETLDAARRASLVEDPRLLRVLDVGTHAADDDAGGAAVTYVVSEYVDGESLAARLARGPMPAPLVRTVVGEAAAALERARTAGLHHERLTPASVILSGNDDVKVGGLGVDATLGPDTTSDTDGEAAARADALSLVALAYAGLTGRWPTGPVDGLPAAPQVSGRPVPPSDLVPGVPADLDTLCTDMLCTATQGPPSEGPQTPGDVAERLSPQGEDEERGVGRPPGGNGSQTRLAGRFPVRIGGSRDAVGVVGAGVAAAAAAAGLRPDPGGPAVAAGTVQERWDDLATVPPTVDREPAAAPGAPALDQTKIVLGVLAALVVIGLVLALTSLRNLGDGGSTVAVRPEPQVSTPASGPTTPPATSQAPASAPPAGGPAIQGVRTLDPEGDDGAENDETAPAAIDGDPATAWQSSTYNSADFGGLKHGVGMVVDLGRPSPLSGVRLEVGGRGGTVEVRTAEGPALDGSTVVGTAEIAGAPVDVALATPVETQYLILWVTRLPQTDAGFRVELAGVQVR